MLGILLKRRTAVGTVLDGRGARLDVRPPDGLEAVLRGAGLEKLHKRAKTAALPLWVRGTSWGAIAMVCCGSGAIAVMTLGDAMGWHTVEWIGKWGIIAGWTGVGVLGLISAWGTFRHGPTATALGLVAVGRCGVCAYPLEGLAPAGDGCTVCPECGAAWRVRGGAS